MQKLQQLSELRGPAGGQSLRKLRRLERVNRRLQIGFLAPVQLKIERRDLRRLFDLLGIPGRPAHPIEWKAVIDARPEVLVISACGFSLDRSVAEADTALRRVGALAGETWVVDGNAFFSRPGPRLVDSVEILAGILHPAVVASPPASVARRLR